MRIVISIFAAFFVTLALFYLMQTMIRGGGQNIEKPENYGVVDFIRLKREPEDAKSQPLKRTLPRKPPAPPASLPPSEMNLAAVHPPAAAQTELAREPMEPMRLGKPYLGPLTVVIPKNVPPKQPKTINKINPPPKPIAEQKIGIKPNSVAKASPLHRETPSSTQVSSGQQPVAAAPSLSGGVGNYEGEAVPIFKMEPKYPRKAAKSRVEGWVKVEFTITEKGTVTNAKVVDSRPRRTFDRSAVQSIRKWRFKPKIVDGKPVQREASQVIEFKLARG